MAELLPLDEAIAIVLGRAERLGDEAVALEHAAGRVLSAVVAAVVDLPPFPSSAMDGFAVRSADVPARLPVVARIAAGRPAPGALEAGQAMAIATGGVVPDGADAVVPVENAAESDGAVEVGDVTAGAHIRPRGGDATAGQVVVPAGTRLGPPQIGALAAAGVPELRCTLRPRVAILATGTELRAPGETLRPGEIYEANGALLAAAAEAQGGDVERIGAVEDDARTHREALERALEADVVVTSGGVSVGPHDLVRRVALDLEVDEVFWRVAVKPGKPVSFGTRGRTLLFGLPGNPVSTLVGFELFVRPALRALEGERDPGPRFERDRLARAVRRNEARDELVRARRTADGLVPLSGQDSHMIVRAAEADALVLVRRGAGELAAGATVEFLPL